MRNVRNAFTAVAILAAFLLSSAGVVNAQKRNEREVRDAVRSINSKLDDFESNVSYQMQSSGSGDVQAISDKVRAMRGAVQRFESNLDAHREDRADVTQIVNVAASIDDLLIQNPQNRRVTDNWQDVRRQLDRLASSYGVKNDWENNYGVPVTGSRVKTTDPPEYDNQSASDPTQTVFSSKSSSIVPNVGLSGTYSIDTQQTENIDEVVDGSGASGENKDDLKDKLAAPDQIAIDVRGIQVTLATTTASPVTFTADGRDKTENVNGKTLRLRATLTGDKLVVSSLSGDMDYTITLTSSGNGQVLKVSRRITTDYLNQTVFAESVYNKTDNVAKLGISGGGGNYPGPVASNGTTNDPIVNDNNGVSTGGATTSSTSSGDSNGSYSDNDQGNTTIANGGTNANNGNYGNGGNRNGGSRNGGYNRTGQPSAVYVKPGNYIVPDGSMITGRLQNDINTKISQNGDRFRMAVESPDEFRGAVLEGYISNIQRSGKITGEAAVTFNFERITLRDGRSYDFAGTLRTAADTNGKMAKVDNEGTIRGESQTTNTAKRGGIGAGLGAIIGLIAGGGKGAAIGAILGGGGGAGSVYIQGSKDVQLNQGSTLTIQSAAPAQLAR